MPNDFQTIDHYLPHRRGMLLVDRLLAADEEGATCELTVRDGLFAHEDGVPAWVGIEYMAQTVATWAGAGHARRGTRQRPGFLLGSRRYTAHVGAFALGTRLRVTVRCELLGDNGLGMFDCRIQDADTEALLAQARVSVYEQAEGKDTDLLALLQTGA
ncbi:hypothetical protein DW355_11255 [Hylemonella gracilis]|jgi:predicted hotdog family 3-hydroxylacyl-ACP dehydratase|uniref:3-hydroxylacyl-ACP dehydratase n=1 Tax=Hylemonella gracilis TaxID=80880 RepID=A0A4P6UJN0_9BURK|nr:hypothetical protein [Hylemonella gracilis]QBK05253.1 hypothetical protein DW355_11255 [Hylemonella gracilis]